MEVKETPLIEFLSHPDPFANLHSEIQGHISLPKVPDKETMRSLFAKIHFQTAELTYKQEPQKCIHLVNVSLNLLHKCSPLYEKDPILNSELTDYLLHLVLTFQMHSHSSSNCILELTVKNNCVTILILYRQSEKAMSLLKVFVPELENELTKNQTYRFLMSQPTMPINTSKREDSREDRMVKLCLLLISSYLNLIICAQDLIHKGKNREGYSLTYLIGIVKQGYKIANQVLGEEEFKAKFKNVLKSLLSNGFKFFNQIKKVSSVSNSTEKVKVEKDYRSDSRVHSIFRGQMKINKGAIMKNKKTESSKSKKEGSVMKKFSISRSSQRANFSNTLKNPIKRSLERDSERLSSDTIDDNQRQNQQVIIKKRGLSNRRSNVIQSIGSAMGRNKVEGKQTKVPQFFKFDDELNKEGVVKEVKISPLTKESLKKHTEIFESSRYLNKTKLSDTINWDCIKKYDKRSGLSKTNSVDRQHKLAIQKMKLNQDLNSIVTKMKREDDHKNELLLVTQKNIIQDESRLLHSLSNIADITFKKDNSSLEQQQNDNNNFSTKTIKAKSITPGNLVRSNLRRITSISSDIEKKLL